MDYYKVLGLRKEPFSTSPDPDFFYRASGHLQCLQRLEIAIRLRRGLCLVRGEVGTGKTTICRQLIRKLGEDGSIQVHLILDPGFDHAQDLAYALNSMLNSQEKADSCSSLAQHKEIIKNRLFQLVAEQDQNVVLIIDEGQKLPSQCLELLRELLNYETNQQKLLQIVIFAQQEIQELLRQHPNFTDRIALEQNLDPLSRKETRELVHFRLQKARGRNRKPSEPRFTPRAWIQIYRLSQGYPRKIVHLGHQILTLLLVKNKFKVTPEIVRQAAASISSLEPAAGQSRRPRKTMFFAIGLALLLLISLAALGWWQMGSWNNSNSQVRMQASATSKSSEESPPKQEADSSAQLKPSAEQGFQPISKPGPDFQPLPAEHKAQKAETSQEPEMPQLLGQISIKPEDHLWHMLEFIYGQADLDILQALQDANPGLDNPNLLESGEEILLPIYRPGAVQKGEEYWLKLGQFQDLEQAYSQLRGTEESKLRVLSYWNPEEGLKHAVVLRESFKSREQAEQALQDLEQDLSKQTDILELDRKKTHLLTPAQDAAP
ncbi:MAG: ExeA family protein [Desulfohalobiaceae bacterium]